MIQDSFSDQYSTLLCLLFLAYASWLDKKTGFVSNRFWLIALMAASFSSVYSCMTSEPVRTLVNIILSIAVTLPISLVLFKVKIFGGSDAKALIMLSIFIPTLTPFFRSSPVPLLPSLSATINLVVLLTLILAINATRNLVICYAKDRGLLSADALSIAKLLLLCGYRRSNLPDQRRDAIFFPGSTIEGAPASIVVVKNERFRIDRRSKGSRHTNDCLNPRDTELWVQLRIPLIPVLTLSLLVSLLFGDLLLPLAT